MDVELIILVIVLGGVYLFYNNKASAPVPGIGDFSGSSLAGPTIQVEDTAMHILPFYETANTGNSGQSDTSNKPLEDPNLPSSLISPPPPSSVFSFLTPSEILPASMGIPPPFISPNTRAKR